MKKAFKCKSCGGSLSPIHNYLRCDYCSAIYDNLGDSVSPMSIYEDASNLQNNSSVHDNQIAKELFESISNYRDSSNKIRDSYANIDNIKIKEEEERLQQIRDEELAIQEKQRNKEKTKKIAIVSGVAIVGIIIIFIVGNFVMTQSRERAEKQAIYESAILSYENHEYDDAMKEFETIIGYKDSKAYLNKCVDSVLEIADDLMGKNQYDDAMEWLLIIPESIDGYERVEERIKDVKSLMVEYKISEAEKLFDTEKYEEAQKTIIDISEENGVRELLDKIGEKLFDKAKKLSDEKKYDECIAILDLIDEKVEWVHNEKSENLLENMRTVYRDAVMAEARGILQEQGYTSFRELLSSKKNAIFSTDDINAIESEIDPTELISVEPFSENGYIYVGREYSYYTGPGDGEAFKDNLGNEYQWGINRRVPNASLGDSYIEYDVKEYNYLSGLIILNDYTKTELSEGRVVISGDGHPLYTSPAISRGFEPQRFNIDISGVDIIKIEFDGNSVLSPSGWGYVPGFPNPSIIEATLSK